MLPFRRKGAPLSGATVPEPCQMRSKTENPCPHPAVVEIRGVAFCGPCAREQEAYFAIGELVAREGERGLRGKPLAIAAYDSPNGCIVSPSIEAKRHGIKTGMPVR